MSTTRQEIYADHAATTPVATEVIAAMQPYLGSEFGNPSSVHRRGEAAREAIEEARARVAALIGGTPEEIVFTATGSEANNLGLKGVMGSSAARRRIVLSAIEHPSVLETAHSLCVSGHEVTVVAVGPDGLLDPARVARALGTDVALVSVMLVNNEIGVIQDVEQIGEI